MFKPFTLVKVVRHRGEPFTNDMRGHTGVVVRPQRPYRLPVVVMIPGCYSPYRPPGECYLWAFHEDELEPILDRPVEQEESALER